MLAKSILKYFVALVMERGNIANGAMPFGHAIDGHLSNSAVVLDFPGARRTCTQDNGTLASVAASVGS